MMARSVHDVGEPRSPINGVWCRSGTTMDGEVCSRSVNPFIVSLGKRIFPVGCPFRQSVRKIITSFLLVFVARRSLSSEWLCPKYQGKLCSSLSLAARQINDLEEEQEQPYCKYWLDKLFAKFMKDRNPYPAPPPEFVKPLFHGFCQRSIRRRLLKSDGEFLYSLQRGAKLAWPLPPESVLLKALKRHRAAFSTDPSPIKDENMIREIQHLSYEVFSALRPTDFTKFLPSSHSSFEAPRSKGGSASLFEPLPPITFSSEGGSLGSEAARIGKLPVLHHHLERHRYRNFHRCGSEVRLSPNLSAKVVALPEPGGKYRILTVGSGRLYSYLQPLQGGLLKCWKRRPESTMLESDLCDKVQEMVDRRPPSFNLMASVDYSAATDGLKRHSTMIALSGIPDEHWRSLAIASFSQGTVSYPDPLGGNICSGEGQPMGHPLSFPLLCVINLACYRRALARWVERADWGSSDWERRQAIWADAITNVIVNGDDMLFPADDELYKLFCEEVGIVGFRLSPGKNYLTPDYASINSQLFRISPQGRVSRVGYLNQRLVEGQCLKSGASSATPTQVAAEVNKMVATVPWTACTIPLIMGRWKSKGQFRPNWYLPVHLGGYGVHIRFAPDSISFTPEQRKLAARFLREPRLSLYRSIGLPDLHDSLKGMAPSVSFSDEPVPPEVDALTLRLMYINQWINLGKPPGDVEHLPRRLKSFRGISPMSDAGLARHWDRYPVVVNRASVPDLQPFSTSFSFEVGESAWKSYDIIGSYGVVRRNCPNRWGSRVTGADFTTSPLDPPPGTASCCEIFELNKTPRDCTEHPGEVAVQ